MTYAQKLSGSIALLLLILSIACGSSNNSTPSNSGVPVLQSIQVSPGAPSIAAGLGQQFTATGKYSDGSSKDLTQSASWSSSNTAIAMVSGSGMATSKVPGLATITATFSGAHGSATLNVTAATVVSLVVSPASTSIAPGTAVQFTATGTFTDGSTQNVTASVTWAVADPSVANINVNGAQGLAKGVAPGTSMITATSGNVSSSATLTVTSAVLNSIAVTPVNASIPLGLLQQFSATGTFSDGTTQDITNTVNWNSSNAGVASITVSGLVTARNLGNVTIMATTGATSGGVSMSVNASNLSSLSIAPGNATIAETTSQQFSAIGTFNDGSTHNLTGQVTWASSNTAVATLTQANGLAKGLTPGVSTISATLGSANASATINVTNATITSISVTPTGQTIPAGTKLPYTATGSFSDTTTQTITRDVTWASDSLAVANITGGGLATALAPGNANISATLNGVTGSAPLNVSSLTLTSIAVSPATASLAPASTLYYSAAGTYNDGSTRNITNAVTWSSSASNVATISNVGQVMGQSTGIDTITAQQGSISGSVPLLVDPSPLVSVQITPSSATIAQQTSLRFKAVGEFADGSTQNLTNSVIWTSSPSSVATISGSSGSRGTASGIAPGNATITAAFAGQVGTALLKVTNATLTSITITPSSASIAVGSSEPFGATGHFTDGTTQDLTNQVTWTSTNANVATINTGGVATSASPGTTTITASMLGVNATAVLTVF